MKRRAVRRTRKETTKRIIQGSKILVIWEHGLDIDMRRSKGTTIIAKVLVAFWYGFNVMEQPVSKMLSLAGQSITTSKCYDLYI